MLRRTAVHAQQLLASTWDATALAAACCRASHASFGVTSSACSTSYSTSSSTASASSSDAQAPAVHTAAMQSRSPPWTATRLLDKRKVYPKRMRHLITVLEAENVAQAHAVKQIDNFRSGDILEVTVVVPEAERRQYSYKGVCIARSNKGVRSWFKIYNVFPDVGGFVQHFPLYMPDLLSVKVVGRIAKARRSKLYYLLENETSSHSYQQHVQPLKP